MTGSSSPASPACGAPMTSWSPELAPLMSQAVADDGLVAMLSPRWQPFQKMLSVAGSVAVITSVVVGGDAGVIVFGVSRLLYLAIAVGAAAGALALGGASWYQWRHWCQTSRPASRDVPHWPSRSRGRATAATSWGQERARRDAAV